MRKRFYVQKNVPLFFRREDISSNFRTILTRKKNGDNMDLNGLFKCFGDKITQGKSEFLMFSEPAYFSYS